MRKPFKELNLSNAFLFAAALSDEETCQMVLELILGHEIPKVSVRTEYSILFSSDFKSVRLDVYASDCYQVAYNVEMQNDDRKNLSKRCRYHQAEMDVTSLKPGQDYRDLQPCFVIFICTYDPFGDGLYRYTVENICRETGKPFGDEAMKILLSTKGKNEEEVPKELIHFLRYVEDSTEECAENTKDVSVKKLHEKVKMLKESRELEGGYMRFEELLQEREESGKAEGKAEGKEEGKAVMLCLIEAMTQDGLLEQIPQLVSDPEFFRQMIKKYNL